jgi:starch synthase
MDIAILTKEYPPHTYGGAGVHVEYLTRELEKLIDGTIRILCFGDQREASGRREVIGVEPCSRLSPHRDRLHGLVDTLMMDATMIGTLQKADIIHCHTWYTHLAGCLLKQMLKAPLVLTTHSLEPNRPWKREQLGTGYDASSWLERTAYRDADGVIAVSAAMKQDVHRIYGVPIERIELIHNGIDENQYHPVNNPDVLKGYGIDVSRPYVLMVSRLTRQKGIIHFLEAAKHLEPGLQVVMCASVPDTAEYMQEIAAKVSLVRTHTTNKILWVSETVPREALIALYSHAALFVCPSIYEPFGIINIEAMACGTAVVASAVGGIPEVVEDGVTGRLVSFEPLSEDNPEPKDGDRFAKDLAHAVNTLLAAPDELKSMAAAARKRVAAHFTWKAVARKTLDFYKKLTAQA